MASRNPGGRRIQPRQRRAFDVDPEFHPRFHGHRHTPRERCLRAAGGTPKTLFSDPRIEASFNIEKGMLHNVDVVRAIQSPLRGGVRGGSTRFDVLGSTPQIVGKRYSYRQLRLNSGPMNASGSFETAPGGELSGRIAAEVGSSPVIEARGTLNVAGTVKSPLLRP